MTDCPLGILRFVARFLVAQERASLGSETDKREYLSFWRRLLSRLFTLNLIITQSVRCLCARATRFSVDWRGNRRGSLQTSYERLADRSY